MPRIAVHPDVVVWWRGGQASLRNLETGVTLPGDAALVAVLAAFARPGDARRRKPVAGLDAEQTRLRIRLLRRWRFLIPAGDARRARSRLRAWKGNVASALHLTASRDLRYATRGVEGARVVAERLAIPRPPLTKTHRGAPCVALPGAESSAAPLASVLAARRTTRTFRREPVPLADLGALVSGTFGATGTHSGAFGELLLKTSPSAGSLHPVECYVVAWNVRGLPAGVYHYEVRADALRRLRRGRFARDAVRAASGQSWVGGAAFVCVLTAVVARSLWKYDDELTYRTLWLDAGHLAQTFCLLATARDLGPFTTAAIQESVIEKLIRLDGVEEIPLYLCGAGIPGRPRVKGAVRRRSLR